MAVFNLDNDAFRSYVTCGTVSIVKMMCMGPMTSFHRLREKAFANPEDAGRKYAGYELKTSETVDRIKRSHLNDIENIPTFLALGALYLTTNPDSGKAIWHFRIFAVARFIHTIAYLSRKQPFRGIAYVVGAIVNFSMAAQVLYAVYTN